jgi:hypothetical protein
MVKVSYILEGIIAQTAYDIELSGIGRRIKDILVLAAMRNSGTRLSRMLKKILTESQLTAIEEHIDVGLKQDSRASISAAGFLRDYREYLILKHSAVGFVSTVDLFIDTLEDSSTLLYQAFMLYAKREKEYYESSQYSHSTLFSNVCLG